MTSKDTVTLTRQEYEALIERNTELEDALAAIDADDGVRIPHAVAIAIINGESPSLPTDIISEFLPCRSCPPRRALP